MADLSDVTAYLKAQAIAAVYPNGIGNNNSIAGMDVRVMEGWPMGDGLELDLQGLVKDQNTGVTAPRPNGKAAQVSVFQVPGSLKVYQIQNKTYTIVPPSYGMIFNLPAESDTITVSGQPKAGEYLTVIADDAHVYSCVGDTTQDLLAALAAAAQADYPAASSTATTLTIPVQFSLVVRQGGTATLGRVTHRQKHSVMVTVWAPDPATRTTLAAAIDNTIKQTNKAAMPDTSQAIITYDRTYITDEQQAVTVYRRDLIYEVEYATVFQFTGYVITSTQVSITNPSNSAIATATT